MTTSLIIGRYTIEPIEHNRVSVRWVQGFRVVEHVLEAHQLESIIADGLCSSSMRNLEDLAQLLTTFILDPIGTTSPVIQAMTAPLGARSYAAFVFDIAQAYTQTYGVDIALPDLLDRVWGMDIAWRQLCRGDGYM